MKKIVLILIIMTFITSLSYAEEAGKTEYERKLEYRRKKIEIILRSQLVGRTTGYSDTDVTSWAVTNTMESFSYGTSNMSGRRGETVSFEHVSEWVIIRGGIRELSDLEFLEITGNKEMAQTVKMKMDDRNEWGIWGTTTFFIGLGTIIAASTANPVDSNLITTGSLLTVGGFLLNAVMGAAPRHYINSDYAQEEADNYNIGLKKSLKLTIDYE